ncbi:chromatin accessibility complex protein 1-like [Lineus longissimus]|uniref:chromatin accessibility complex protein 1-like n=1 Tax=Lineus longissimus TaxID=88925 RepID=UPI002B4CA770
MADKSNKAPILLPLSRIKTIMKSSPDVSNIGNESLMLIAKATELFVQDLALLTMKNAENKKDIEYNDLANIVFTDETLQFLQDIIPQKIKYSEYQELMKNIPDEDSS